MIRALYTAASGMTAQQTNIDNVAHNLANVNTTGFKKSLIKGSVTLLGQVEGSDEVKYLHGNFGHEPTEGDLRKKPDGYFADRYSPDPR